MGYDQAMAQAWVTEMEKTLPRERGKKVAQWAAQIGTTAQTVYRYLSLAGFDSGRKQRADAGRCKVPESELRQLAGVARVSHRETGKQTMSIKDAVSIAVAGGTLTAVSPGHVGRLLRARNMHPAQLLCLPVHIAQRSEHPNDVWQGDASVCILYYLSNGMLRVMERDKFYKNKPQNLQRIVAERVIRYVWVDHYSGAFFVHYSLGSEDAENLIDSFICAITKREDEPLHGVPYHVMLDPGAANVSALAKNLFTRLQIKLLVHTPGLPRAKGAVEVAHNIVERKFEGRLRFQRIEGVADLNRLVRRWLLKANGQDVHTRHGKTRNAVWLTWKGEQLRIAPGPDVLRSLIYTKPQVRTVEGDRSISFGGRRYRLDLMPDAFEGRRVEVAVNPYESPAIRVCLLPQNWDGVSRLETDATHTVQPVKRDFAGFDEDAVLIGREFRAAKDSPVDTNRKALMLEAYNVATLEEAEKRRRQKAVPYEGRFDAFADVNAYQPLDYLPRRGIEMAVSGATTIRMLTVAEACRALKTALGTAYGAHVYEWVQAKFGDAGVPEEQIEALVAQFSRGPNERSLTAPLRVVGGAE